MKTEFELLTDCCHMINGHINSVQLEYYPIWIWSDLDLVRFGTGAIRVQ